MQPVNLFDLAAQQANWLSARQATTAGNIANINTPGYRALDVEPFKHVLDNTQVRIEATNPRHQQTGITEASYALNEEEAPELLPSENSVVLEDEIAKSGEIRREYELNTAIVKSFHRMIMSTVRG